MTRAELADRLAERGVPRDSYSLVGGLPNEAYCLAHEGGRWVVYYSERGQRTGSAAFATEAEACDHFLRTGDFPPPMTDAGWPGCSDPSAMLAFLAGRVTDRKLRLFAVACCRRVKDVMTDNGVLAVVAAELFADGLISGRGMHAAWGAVGHPKSEARGFASAAARAASVSPGNLGPAHAAASAVNAADAHGPATRTNRVRAGEKAAQADLLRCIFGNPYRPVAADPSWVTPTVAGLADAIYTDRAFDRLPILADALEEAGCDNADILTHCRGDGPHVRGCWVVDLVLGKE